MIGHYYLQFSLEVTILAYIAVQVAALALAQTQPKNRDFYVVRHLCYDLVFTEHPGVSYVTAKRGPLAGGHTHSFSDFGAAKAFFDHLEGMGGGWDSVEEVNEICVVSGRRPPPENTFTRGFTDKPLGVLVQKTPYSVNLSRRKEACDERRPVVA
jgi:hypothetical protein